MRVLINANKIVVDTVATQDDEFPVHPNLVWEAWLGSYLIIPQGKEFTYIKVSDSYSPTGSDFLIIDLDGSLVNDPFTIVDSGSLRLRTQQEVDSEQATDDLSASDTGMIRVLEDLVATLIANGTITLTDLPQEAQDKITLRSVNRSKL